MDSVFTKYLDAVREAEPIKYEGRVFAVRGLLIESRGPQAVIGELCRLETKQGEVPCEVVGLHENTVQLMAYAETGGIEVGSRVRASGRCLDVAVSQALLGRVLGPLGTPIDGKGDIPALERVPVIAPPPSPLSRERITKRIVTGIRAIDGLLAVGRGQRLGVFAGSGVGKSTFQGMIARNTAAGKGDAAAGERGPESEAIAGVNVIALVGERGREVRDFLENDLGPEGLAKSVVVAATSDQPALSRLRGAYVATAIAEYFRDQGLNVMFLFDSITRFARAQREIGLARGEPPAQRGYTPSVFDAMPKLLERCGASDKGTITGFYTVLVDGDDLDEPVSDTVRGILDGHIILSRALAERSHYPAIDVLASISRLAPTICGPETRKAMAALRRLMAAYAQSVDLIDVGAYQSGSNPLTDEAIAKHEAIEEFLCQAVDEKCPLSETLTQLGDLTGVEIPEAQMRQSL